MSLFGFDTSDFDDIVNDIASSSVDIFLSKDNKYYHEVDESDDNLANPDVLDQLLNELQGTVDVKYIEKEYMSETEASNNDGMREAVTKSIFTTPDLVPTKTVYSLTGRQVYFMTSILSIRHSIIYMYYLRRWELLITYLC